MNFPYWQVLEAIPGQDAVAAVWQKHLGPHYPAFSRAFLQPTADPVQSYPCPRHPGCAHQVVRQPDGRLLGICCCGRDCGDLVLTAQDVIAWELSWSRLGRALAQGLELAPRAAELHLYNTRQIGSWSAAAVPVILTIQTEPHDFHFVVADLVARFRQRFILLAPTSELVDATALELLANVQAGFWDLTSHVQLSDTGALQPDSPPAQLFATVVPECSLGASPSPLSPPPGRFSLRRGLGVWHLTFEGQSAELKHERGLFYVAYLLTHPPAQPLHALDLAAQIPDLYRRQLGLPELDDPATGRRVVLASHARLQQRSLALDEAQSFRALLRQQRELEAILDSEEAPEPVKAEALRELAALAQYQRQQARRSRDSAQQATDTVRKAIRRLQVHLANAVDQSGEPHRVLRPFAQHLQQYLLNPSARYNGPQGRGGLPGLGGGFTYEPPAGVVWEF